MDVISEEGIATPQMYSRNVGEILLVNSQFSSTFWTSAISTTPSLQSDEVMWELIKEGAVSPDCGTGG